MILLDGVQVAKIKTQELKKKISSLNIKPSLCIIQVGNNSESNKYINKKIQKANEIGILTHWTKFDENKTEEEIIKYIQSLEHQYDGIIVQLPLPTNLNKQNILDSVPIAKDVDGLSSFSMSRFYNDDSNCHAPATAKAILMLLTHYKIELQNKTITVVGESNLVGKPIKHLLSKYTNKINSKNINTGILGTETSDILIVAAGSPLLINKNNVKENAVVVDVGINTLNNKIVGDVDFENVKQKCLAISPVPGGVGPLTVISLLENVINSCTKKVK